eukprot:8335514-Ditylum_brightwellii.AAC.1
MGTTTIWFRMPTVSGQNILVVNMMGLDKRGARAGQQKQTSTRGNNTSKIRPNQTHTKQEKPK